ncbi:hypothetical protein [Streptomyces sp. NRRL B-24572]|uniref:hypothetical protein n=1 Tax=Streptomyces sp. NRRL B-24572 TaxID=1962156 RepID=UPI00117FC709|nr:hypothetical protein [Streptomyces sp. NRRL B-24572]
MSSPTRVTRSLCAALLAATVLVGCGGAEEDGAGGGSGSSASPAAAGKSSAASDPERDYYGCLEKNGVKIETAVDGELRVVKNGGNEAALAKAEGKCAGLLPARDTTEGEGGAAEADPAFAACMKAEGFATYDRADLDGPDKDALTAAVKKCRPGTSDKPVVGG